MITDDHVCVDECDHAPKVCLDCGVWYPVVFAHCPRCQSTHHLDQETGREFAGSEPLG